MAVIGLTGTVGSGKSTVAEMFAKRKATVIDADKIAHKLTAKGTPVFKKILEAFGKDHPEILGGSGALDREALAGVIFRSAKKREVLNDIEDRFLPEVLTSYPGVTYALEGEQREERESLRGLGRNSLFALLVIFTLLAIPLRSYAQPLVIMATIPLGAVGAIAGHAMLGLPLSFSSVIGMVALAGVVVNDSIVLIHRANRLRREGQDLDTAVRDAAAARFRPIFLTSLTTIGGLLPLLFEKSFQAQFLIPMAITLVFGLMATTFLVLLLIPSMIAIQGDVGYRVRRRKAVRHAG